MGFMLVPVSLSIVPQFYGARLTEEEEEEEEEEEGISTKQRFCRFQVGYLKHSNGSFKWLRWKR